MIVLAKVACVSFDICIHIFGRWLSFGAGIG